MENFLFWVNEELKTRGWSVNELSKRANLSNSAVYATLSQRNAVTWEFCAAIATAFQLPPEEVFRRAGLLKKAAEKEKVQEVTDIAHNLSDNNLVLLKEIATALYKNQEGNE